MEARFGLFFFMLMTCGIAFFILSCRKEGEKELGVDKVGILKKKYSAAAINYFYETVFHEDDARTNRENVHKWKSDPKIVLIGNPSSEEIGYVKDAILKINRLNLPIKCTLENKGDSNVIELFFADFKDTGEYLKADAAVGSNADTSRHLGIARTMSYNGTINKAHIGIFYNKYDTIDLIRKNIVLEEIIQSLGITGDSYTYPKSLFFQNYNPSKSFNQLDCDVLSLLYETAIPLNYPRKSFERDFADVLYHVNVEEKVKGLLQKFPRQFSIGDELEACFTNGELLKHPKEVEVYLTGTVGQGDSVTLKKAITSINKMSSNLSIRLVQPGVSEPDHGIVLNLQQVKSQIQSIQRTVNVSKGKDCMFPKLIKNNVLLSFNSSSNARTFRQRSIVDALYFSLVQLPQARLGDNKLAEIGRDSIRFNKHYADLLKLIYADEFIDGLKLGDFKKIKLSVANVNFIDITSGRIYSRLMLFLKRAGAI